MSSVTPSGPHIHRGVARATWVVKHRWGPNIGDITEYTVAKREGVERVSISGLSGRGNENWPAELARELNAAINAALEWNGEDPEPKDSNGDNGFQAAQTRDNDGEILSWGSVTEAFEYAEPDDDVWKISFNDSNGRRVRLVRTTDEDGKVSWLYRPMEREIADGLERESQSREGQS